MPGRTAPLALGVIVALGLMLLLRHPTGDLEALSVCPPAIAYGDTVQCSIDLNGEVDTYVFEGATGEQILVRVFETTGDLDVTGGGVRVIRPTATELCDNFVAFNEIACTLDASGAHTLEIEDASGEGTGGYHLFIQRLTSPVGCAPATHGAPPLSASIDAAAEADCFTFTASVGDQLYVRAFESSGLLDVTGGGVDVYRPDGTKLCDNFTAFNERQCAIDATGTHTLLVSDANGLDGGTYNLYVQLLNAPVGCGTPSFGLPVTAGSVVDVAEADCFTFSASDGDQLLARVFETGGLLDVTGGGVDVYRPNGTKLCDNFTAFNERQCAIDATGTHTLLVSDANGLDGGTYNLYVQLLNAPVGCVNPILGGPPVGASVVDVAEADCFVVPATNGDQLLVRVFELDGTLDVTGGGIDVYRSDGTKLCDNFTAFNERQCAIDATGTHTILVSDSGGSETGSYCLFVALVPPVWADDDSDCHPNDADNCASAANFDQANNDAAGGTFGGTVPPAPAWILEGVAPEGADVGGDACDPDDDNDGCIDDDELGLLPQRDPLVPWDFADVPVPSLPGLGARNAAVTLADVLATLEWTGTMNDGPPGPLGRDYDDDSNANGVEDGAEYDRRVLQTIGVSGPPDGAIGLSDVLVVLAQSGDSCTEPV